jgi:ubiquitin thioesterase OTU1
MTLSPMETAPPSFHTTVFPVSDSAVMDAAQKMVDKLKGKKYYTDTANFDLKCNVCSIGLKGEKAATDHAMATGRESAYRAAI